MGLFLCLLEFLASWEGEMVREVGRSSKEGSAGGNPGGLGAMTAGIGMEKKAVSQGLWPLLSVCFCVCLEECGRQ